MVIIKQKTKNILSKVDWKPVLLNFLLINIITPIVFSLYEGGNWKLNFILGTVFTLFFVLLPVLLILLNHKTK